jgi:hypothetical protein
MTLAVAEAALYRACTASSLFGTRSTPVVRDGFLLVRDPLLASLGTRSMVRDMVRDYPLPPEGHNVRHRQCIAVESFAIVYLTTHKFQDT